MNLTIPGNVPNTGLSHSSNIRETTPSLPPRGCSVLSPRMDREAEVTESIEYDKNPLRGINCYKRFSVPPFLFPSIHSFLSLLLFVSSSRPIHCFNQSQSSSLPSCLLFSHSCLFFLTVHFTFLLIASRRPHSVLTR